MPSQSIPMDTGRQPVAPGAAELGWLENPPRPPMPCGALVLGGRLSHLENRLRAAAELAAEFGQVGLVADPAALAMDGGASDAHRLPLF
jgi:hypothetical protein